MAKRVSAGTITDITSDPDFAGAAPVPKAPTSKELVRDIRRNLNRLENKARQLLERHPDDPGRTTALARATEQRKEFERIIATLPDGFALAPVWYSKIPQEKNARVQDEYLDRVRREFLKFVGANYEKELLALGICQHGVDRLKKGIEAADKDGNIYDLSIDHIVERSGSGLWAETASKRPDPDNPSGRDAFPVNHFGNFILLPEKIHQMKNALNTLQRIEDGGALESRWMLMLVPERTEAEPHFVAPAQKPGHPLHGVERRPPDVFRKISHAAFIVDQTRKSIRAVLSHEAIAANDNKAPLAEVFDRAAKKDPAVKAALDDVRPQLDEAHGLVKGLFNEVATRRKLPKGKRAYEAFVEFFDGRQTHRLRDAADQMPFVEAKRLRESFDEISRLIALHRADDLREMGRARDANDNAPKEAPAPKNEKPEKGPKAPQSGRRKR